MIAICGGQPVFFI